MYGAARVADALHAWYACTHTYTFRLLYFILFNTEDSCLSLLKILTVNNVFYRETHTEESRLRKFRSIVHYNGTIRQHVIKLMVINVCFPKGRAAEILA